MEIDLELNTKRLEVKDEITEGINKTPMARLFNVTGKVVQKITRYPKPLPLVYCIAVISPVILLISLLSYETQMMMVVQLGLFPSIVLGEVFLISVILTYFNINKVLRGIRNTLIDSIMLSENLSNLQQWLFFGWSSKTIKRFLLFYWICLSLYSLFLFVGNIEFLSFGSLIYSFTFGFLGSIVWYYVPLMLLLPMRLKFYQYELYENDPARSEIIESMSALLNRFTFGYVFIALIFQFSFSLINLSILTVALFTVILIWIPLIIQFTINQICIRNIISSSKRKTLNRIQAEIKMLHDGDIKNKENIEAINRLMDYHERIRVTPNSNLNLGGFLNFLNQLALPLLGLLLGNIDKVIAFFH